MTTLTAEPPAAEPPPSLPARASAYAAGAPHRPAARPIPAGRTIWGLDALQLHARYWASLGAQVVRQGEPSQIVKHAELYLLTDPRSLPLFHLSDVIDTLNWIAPQVLFVRLHDTRERAYRETVVVDGEDRFVRFQRSYDTADRLARVVLTPDRRVAQLWQRVPDPLTGWRRLRRYTPRTERVTVSVDGQVYDRTSDQEIAYFLHDLVRDWKRPDATIARAKRASLTGERSALWADPESQIDPAAKSVGPVWVGAGRQIGADAALVGPAVVWDDPGAAPAEQDIQWLTIEPSDPPDNPQPRDAGAVGGAAKRAFDLAFALCAVLATFWLYPLIMLAIWIEDGRPFFFAHRRETRGGREFPCVKFRSMRKDAEQIKAKLLMQNQADGPQFFMKDDPRLTRVGKLLRKTNLDELPQFLNVLRGEMSIVGPRPSPYKENQYCPPWREARLSVRPGITGLWQLKRTRQAGTDFQEWNQVRHRVRRNPQSVARRENHRRDADDDRAQGNEDVEEKSGWWVVGGR